MPSNEIESIGARLRRISQSACQRYGISPVNEQRLDDALSTALDPRKLIDNLAEVWRASPEDVQALLQEHGLAALVARVPAGPIGPAKDEVRGEPLTANPSLAMAGGRISLRAFNPTLDDHVAAPPGVLHEVTKSIAAFLPGAEKDVLAGLYRHQPVAYAAVFLRTAAPRIDEYTRRHFGETGPRYLVNSGIGANEQFNYLVADLANARPNPKITWLLANSPKEIANLPQDATVENTLFMEFSRSGITQETVKLHELTPPAAKRIVFANSGPLRALAERDQNLVLELPGEVSGRYGRNKTPILMAPMHVVGLDILSYWKDIEAACQAMDISDRDSPPVVLAQYIRLQQLRRSINHIYLGTNDPLLRCSADEFCQFWNEGVNRDGNDITVSRYLGLPRDSHMNLEAILGTSERKMAIFLLRTGPVGNHALLREQVDSLNPDHAGLTAAQTDLVLALANAQRCSEKMPTLLIAVDRADLTTSAWLGQLWADLTLVYARLIGVDPGSNPEVKAVRTRAAQWLADQTAALSLIHDRPPA
jgi:hypothetical protein